MQFFNRCALRTRSILGPFSNTFCTFQAEVQYPLSFHQNSISLRLLVGTLHGKKQEARPRFLKNGLSEDIFLG